jgi:opacity protein-like surface antigen
MKRLFIVSLALILLAVFAVSTLAEGPAAVSTPSPNKSSTAVEKKDTCTEKEKSCCSEKSYKFIFSGYFKGDAVHDLNRTYPGNFVLWVPYGGREDDDATFITARETRMGLNFSWCENGYTTKAKLEYDFYGLGVQPSSGNAMENKAAPMLRHAFLEFTRGCWSVLAGQTSDVISPLVPATVNYTVCWAQGNIGYRRPQFRVSTWAGLGEKAKLKAAAAVTRTLGSDLDGDGFDDGADAVTPTVQGRLGLDMKFGDNGAAVGVSGHYGMEKWGVEDSTETESWSFNTDVKFFVNKRFHLAGEFFVGENLGTYFGGVLQSINPMMNEIFTMGGWGMASVQPHERLTVNAGYAFDDPDDGDFELPEDITHTFIDKNSVIFGNLMYGITSNVTAMLEVSYLKTEYLTKQHETVLADDEDFDSLRIQFALKAAIN